MRQVGRQRGGGDDVAPDRDDPAPQPRDQPIAVAIGRYQDIARLDNTAGCTDFEAAATPNFDPSCRRVVKEMCAAIPSHSREAGEILGRVQAPALLEKQGAMVEGG